MTCSVLPSEERSMLGILSIDGFLTVKQNRDLRENSKYFFNVTLVLVKGLFFSLKLSALP